MRRRLPAYGRELQHARERWRGPPINRVLVIIGRDWGRLPADEFCVCASPDHPPEYYDWSVLAGLPVDVVARDGTDIEPYAGKIGEWGAPVRLHWLLSEPDWPVPMGRYQVDIAEAAFCRRVFSESGAGRWPDWWSDSRDRQYAARKLAWQASQAADTLRL